MEKYYWINDDSRRFLERGYLKEGQTPQERVREIANTAEKILGIPYADKFEDYMSKGWFSLASPVWANFGTDKGLPISCITGECWLNTKNGGKKARHIEVGDEVLTHKGRFRKVLSIKTTKNRDDIFILKVINRMTPIKITGNHQILTNLGWERVDKLDCKKHLVAINGDVEYEEVEHVIDLEPYCDYEHEVCDNEILKVLTKKNQRKLDRKYVEYYSKPSCKIEIDNDLAWALGLWFAEGSVGTNNHHNPNGIRITLNVDEIKHGERWLDIMRKKFNLNGSIYRGEAIHKYNNQHSEWLNVNIHSIILGKFFSGFGKDCKTKTVPDWILRLPKEKLKYFIDGITLGDGSDRSNDANKTTLSNPKLILQVYLIGLKLGKEMSLQMQDKPSKYNRTKHVYTLTFRNHTLSRNRHTCRSGIRFHDGLVYAPISKVYRTNLVRDVYDFEVEEDHSFSVSGVVVHNCNGSYISDTMTAILEKAAETGMMTKFGAGTSAYFGALRQRGAKISVGGKSSGPVHFMELFDSVSNIVSQSNVRRGSFAAYLPVEHPDIDEFLNIRNEGNRIQNISIGVCITDAWMQAMIDGDKDKRKIWAKIIKKRFESGYPYIFFTTTANNSAPQVYKDKGLKISASNLCSEIFLSSDEDNSFVCDLSSLNLLHWDEWKDTDAVEVLTYFLDSVMTEYIEKVKSIPFMRCAYNFALNQRALGIGVLGWHSYLQSKMIAFESMQAKLLNAKIFSTIKEKSYNASKEMAGRYGEAPLLEGYGMRNVTTMAVAPTTSSSFILGQVSPSIEPLNSNYFVKDLEKGKFTYKNPYLKELLIGYKKDNRETWNSILLKGGSVQHLDFLKQEEKDVFKTFGEISQKEVVIQAAQRQKFIDQGQSLNLMIHPNTPPKEVSELLIEGWKLGIKSYYYQRGTNPSQELGRSIMSSCKSCEG